METNRPWEKRENSKDVIGNLLFILEAIAQLIEPFMPSSSEKIIDQIKERKSEPIFRRIR